jgi:hypothetical protein
MIGLHRGPLERGLGTVDKPAVMINWECVVRHSVIGLDGSPLEGRLGGGQDHGHEHRPGLP